jgi:hypothetical protein
MLKNIIYAKYGVILNDKHKVHVSEVILNLCCTRKCIKLLISRYSKKIKKATEGNTNGKPSFWHSLQ